MLRQKQYSTRCGVIHYWIGQKDAPKKVNRLIEELVMKCGVETISNEKEEEG